MQEPQRHYWAFCANPKIYKIEQAVRELREDSWTVPHRNVRADDRAIIWKAKGNDRHRGIIALAEVLTDPKPSIAVTNPDYWVDRVMVRYFPLVLPLWEDETDLQLLKELSVARAPGGSIFHVTPAQWNAIMEAVGGWPGKNSEVEEAERIIEEYTGKKRSGQGFSINADMRRAIEQYAMQKAKAFYEERGWKVFDVSTTHSYDLLCKGDDGEELHVEVKGTISDGTQILLTANEVRHARDHYPKVALFILSRIQVDPTSIENPQGGEIQILEPWKVDELALSPLAFAYNFPKKNAEHD